MPVYPPPPVVLTLLAADRVARSRADGRCDLTGVFHGIALPLPSELTFAVYFVVTNCHVPTDQAVEFLDPADRVLSREEYQLTVADPLAVVQGVGRIDGAPIDRAGRYRLRITSGGQIGRTADPGRGRSRRSITRPRAFWPLSRQHRSRPPASDSMSGNADTPGTSPRGVAVRRYLSLSKPLVNQGFRHFWTLPPVYPDTDT
jgi:hypothetical protein